FGCYPVSRFLSSKAPTTMTSLTEARSIAVSFQKLTRDELPAVASLHCKMFPGQLLTLIGPKLIQRFYEQFITHCSSHAFVAIKDGVVVGFVAGTTNKPELFQRFYRA